MIAPYEVLSLLSALMAGAAWIGHTTASKALADDIVMAARMCGMTHKALAIEMGITPEQLSTQLAGREPLNAFRLYGMTSLDFRKCLIDLQACRLDDTVARRAADISAVVKRLDQLLDGIPKVMARAELPSVSTQKSEAM